MRVSDEMVRRAADAMVMINNQASWADLARAALDAALADVPGPAQLEQWTAWRARAMAAEAKLARARTLPPAWRGHAAIAVDCQAVYENLAGELARILDGKEQP